MEIFINGNKINFELENEKSAFDVINSIADFCSSSTPQQFVTGIYIDGVEFSFADEISLKKTLIKSITTLEMETTDIFGITTLSLNQIEKFISLITDIIEGSKWDSGFANIYDSMDWMKEGVDQIISIFGTEDNRLLNEKIMFVSAFDKLFKYFDKLSKDKYPFEPQTRKDALDLKNVMSQSITNLKNYLKESNKFFDYDTILENINKLIYEVDEMIPKILNVSVLFQTGLDKESMDVIQRLASMLERCIGLFVIFKENFKLYLDKYTVKEVSFEEFFHTLTEHLKELMTSIENNDSVMVGDLLEYEFVPNLEQIKTILLKIKNEAFVKAN